jgi:phospholipase C
VNVARVSIVLVGPCRTLNQFHEHFSFSSFSLCSWCEQQPDLEGFVKEKALTKENLTFFMSMLSFGKFNGKYDTRISGLGVDMLVSDVQNTELKSPKVSKNIPTVAEVTQGALFAELVSISLALTWFVD